MFRIIQTSVVLAITLVLVNESQAGRPGASSGNAASSAKTSPAQGATNNKTTLPITVIGTNKHLPGSTVNTLPVFPFKGFGSPTKNPVHGTNSSHDPRGPKQTYCRDYCNWGHHCFNSRYGCETYWSVADDCYFYFYAPAACYYPITVIEQFPPVATPVTPVAVVPTAGVVAPAAVVPVEAAPRR